MGKGGLLKDWHRPEPKIHNARYFKVVEDWALPAAIPPGYVLAHNHVRRAVDMPHARNGFRCWIWRKDDLPRGWKRCECGWSGLPHYRATWDKRNEAKLQHYRCDSWKTINSWR